MTTRIFLIAVAVVAVLMLPLSPSFAQFQQECGMDPNQFPPEQSNSTIQYGGKYISSTGVLRVLVVWVRFADDNVPSATWPNPAVT